MWGVAEGLERAAKHRGLHSAALATEQQTAEQLGGGLHSSTFQLKVSAFCRTGGAFRGCSGSVYEV